MIGGCFGPKTQTSEPTTDSPKTAETLKPADVIFAYGRSLQYWTYEEHLDGDQIIKGLSSWQLNLVPPKEQQAQGSRVVLRSPYSFPYESKFQPEKVEKEGSQYIYTLPFRTNEGAKPETIIIPPLATTWSQFSTGLRIDAQVALSEIEKGTEIVTIKVTPQRSFSIIWLTLETDKDVSVLSDTASPPTNQWNVSNPRLNKEYTFSIQLQPKNISNKVELYKPRISIRGWTEAIQQTRQSGQTIGIEVPGLGSLSFQASNAGILELDRIEQVVIYLWQSYAFGKVILEPPINGWGFCKRLNAKQDPEGNSLLFSSEEAQAVFWADIDTRGFDKPVSVELYWIDPNGTNHRAYKTTLILNDNTRISDAISLEGLDDSKLGTWHAKLLINGEPILTPFSLLPFLKKYQGLLHWEKRTLLILWLATSHFVLWELSSPMGVSAKYQLIG